MKAPVLRHAVVREETFHSVCVCECVCVCGDSTGWTDGPLWLLTPASCCSAPLHIFSSSSLFFSHLIYPFSLLTHSSFLCSVPPARPFILSLYIWPLFPERIKQLEQEALDSDHLKVREGCQVSQDKLTFTQFLHLWRCWKSLLTLNEVWNLTLQVKFPNIFLLTYKVSNVSVMYLAVFKQWRVGQMQVITATAADGEQTDQKVSGSDPSNM